MISDIAYKPFLGTTPKKKRKQGRPIEVEELLIFLKLYLVEEASPDRICKNLNRPFNSIKVLPWKVATNYEGKGTELIHYLGNHPLLKLNRRRHKWIKRDFIIIGHWRVNQFEKAPLLPRLSIEELATILGREAQAMEKQMREVTVFIGPNDF